MLHLHLACRAPEPDQAHGAPALHQTNNGFSKERQNLSAAVAIHQLGRMHSSIRRIPAIQAGLTRAPHSLVKLLTAG